MNMVEYINSTPYTYSEDKGIEKGSADVERFGVLAKFKVRRLEMVRGHCEA